MDLDKLKLRTKFKVPSFSHCINIEGKSPNIGELLLPMATPTYSSGFDLMTGLANLRGKPNLKLLSSTVVEIL